MPRALARTKTTTAIVIIAILAAVGLVAGYLHHRTSSAATESSVLATPVGGSSISGSGSAVIEDTGPISISSATHQLSLVSTDVYEVNATAGETILINVAANPPSTYKVVDVGVGAIGRECNISADEITSTPPGDLENLLSDCFKAYEPPAHNASLGDLSVQVEASGDGSGIVKILLSNTASGSYTVYITVTYTDNIITIEKDIAVIVNISS